MVIHTETKGIMVVTMGVIMETITVDITKKVIMREVIMKKEATTVEVMRTTTKEATGKNITKKEDTMEEDTEITTKKVIMKEDITMVIIISRTKILWMVVAMEKEEEKK